MALNGFQIVQVYSNVASQRRLVANSHDLALSIIKRLYNDKQVIVRRAIAEQLNASSDIIKTLSHDENPRVQTAALLNPNLPIEILIKINDQLAEKRYNDQLKENRRDMPKWVFNVANRNDARTFAAIRHNPKWGLAKMFIGSPMAEITEGDLQKQYPDYFQHGPKLRSKSPVTPEELIDMFENSLDGWDVNSLIDRTVSDWQDDLDP